MLLDQKPGLQLRATKPKPLMMSILVHILLILLLALSPNWFETSHRRTIRIAGEDFDLNRLELTPLTLPPRIRAPATPLPRPAPAPPEPLLQPPQQATPPPPPPPPPQPPDRVIRPDDLLAEGARPDGSPRASRGDTREQARSGGAQDQQGQQAQSQEAQQAQEARQAQQGSQNRGETGPNRTLPNTNPNAMRSPSPSLLASAGEIVEATLDAARRNQSLGRTGIARGDNNGTFSTEPQILSPNPKGIDFGPYMNQLLTRLRANWISVMPEVARLGQRGRVDIVFTITRSGMVKDLHVVVNSGVDVLDKGAISAIQLSNPFQQLPAEYETDLRLRIAFLYNMYP
jgi:TonB family protein